MSEAIKNIFLNQGSIVDPDGKTPIYLNNGFVWIVLEGKINVYYKKDNEDPLYYLFCADKDTAMIGSEVTGEYHNGSRIVLVGKGLFGSKLIKIERSRFFRLGQDRESSEVVAGLIKRWMLRFSPIYSNGCDAFDIEKSLCKSEDFKKYLSVILNGIAEHHDTEIEKEENRCTKRQNYTDTLFNEAFSTLANVVPKGPLKNAYGSSLDPLCDALKYIGQAGGIEFSYLLDTDNTKKDIQKQLENIAETSGVRFRKVALGYAWWKTDNGPMLAFLKDKTPVALLHVPTGYYILKDPITKKTKRITKEISNNLEKFAYYFYRTLPNNREIRLKDLLKLSLHHCNLRDLKFIVLLGLIGGILGLITPYFIGILFNSVIPGAEKIQVLQIASALFAVSLSLTVFQFARSIAFLRINGKMDVSVQSAIIDRLVNLPIPFFRKYTAGDLSDRANSINLILRTFTSLTIDTMISAIFSSLNFLLLFYYSLKLALFAITASFLYLVVFSIGYSFIFHHQRSLVTIKGRLTGLMQQLINGIPKLRVAGAEKRAFSLWAKEFSRLRKESFKSSTISNYISVFSSIHPLLVMSVIFALVVFFAEKDFTAGDFVAFSAAFAVFQSSFINMFLALPTVLNIIPLYERMVPILKTIPEIDHEKSKPDKLKGGIELNHISFRYGSDSPFVLKDISIQIRPEQFVAIVGPSGSGKSTLLRLLLGFEKPEKGKIFYDNFDLNTLYIQHLRRHIGVVLQNGELMPGDIFTNITGTTNCSLEDAWEAARLAGIDKDISEMPMKMFTKINERATIISGGQKQRLLIARALITKPRILFFDEATSFLDNITQSLIIKNIEKLKSTKIVIAHRLSTIINADLIYVMDKGEIVQSGTFDELIRQEGVFAKVARRQLI